MSRSTVRVTINDKAISGHFGPGGAAYDHLRGVGRQAVGLAKLYAPIRTGELKKSIGGGNVARTGLYGDYMTVYATARHALWVERGTSEIFPHGGWLLLPSTRGAIIPNSARKAGRAAKLKPKERGLIFRRSVSGQEAKRYLARAVEDAMAAHGFAISL